jgi:hypothetical protein
MVGVPKLIIKSIAANGNTVELKLGTYGDWVGDESAQYELLEAEHPLLRHLMELRNGDDVRFKDRVGKGLYATIDKDNYSFTVQCDSSATALLLEGVYKRELARLLNATQGRGKA